MAPVPVTALNCDGDTYKCTANLVRLCVLYLPDHDSDLIFRFLCAEVRRQPLGCAVEHCRVPPALRRRIPRAELTHGRRFKCSPIHQEDVCLHGCQPLTRHQDVVHGQRTIALTIMTLNDFYVCFTFNVSVASNPKKNRTLSVLSVCIVHVGVSRRKLSGAAGCSIPYDSRHHLE